MIEKKNCPYCDDLINIEYDNEYYHTEEGKVFEEVDCSTCGEIIQLDWESCHTINTRRKND